MEWTIKSSELEVSVNSFGAELSSIKTNDGVEYLWQAKSAWTRKAPQLFPFVCNFSKKSYKAGGEEYKSPSNHGFARDSEFELAERTDNSICLMLTANKETLKVYPFDFRLFITYVLKETEIQISYRVENTDKKPIYFYIGGHPGFNCPINDEGSFDDWYVEYEKNETIEQKNEQIDRIVLNSERKLQLSRALFNYDVILKDKPNSKAITLKSDKSSRYVTLSFPDAECIAVWSPTSNDEATFVCLEPWSSVPCYYDDEFDDIENKPHAKKLNCGEVYRFSYSLRIGR